VAFRREKFVPRGGPSGAAMAGMAQHLSGSESERQYAAALPYNPRVQSGPRATTEKVELHGHSAKHDFCRFQWATLVFDGQNGETRAIWLCGQRVLVARAGGRARKSEFCKPWHQAPREHEDGHPGEERHLRLNCDCLRMLDWWLPECGKVDRISVISAARPKIAITFTRWSRSGVVNADGGGGSEGREIGRTYVVADLPGWIEGAHEGAGLESRFLRHVSARGCWYI